MKDLSIGAVAKLTGVKVPTIRFYEDIGLLPRAARSEGNRRAYEQDAVRRLRFIRHARELGFEVDSVRALLRLADSPAAPCDDADAIARQHLARVDEKIAQLQALRQELLRMTDCCASGAIADCRVIETLSEEGHHHQAPNVVWR